MAILNMNENTLISNLTETEILSAVRERFTGQLVEDMDMDTLVDGSTTLGDLFNAIESKIDLRDRDRQVPRK
ncbi:MAG: hypothetical protein QM762_09495 [Chryseolinea sp.]